MKNYEQLATTSDIHRARLGHIDIHRITILKPVPSEKKK